VRNGLGGRLSGNGSGGVGSSFQHMLEPVPLGDVPGNTALRVPTAIRELDRVLGGGFVPGSTVLLGGDPGIGKSTLLLQAAAMVAESSGRTVIYSTGEESADQIKLRADRLGVPQNGLFVVASGDVLGLGAVVKEARPALLVVDSIQTAWHSGVDGSPGSLAQVRESAAELCAIARNTGAAVIFAGHVTKDGAIAGPKVLEHVVDVVLHMEGDSGTPLRLLRGEKNRYGATDELGVFEMRGDGLAGVDEPSALFLSQRQPGASGSAVTTVIEGTRPLTVEVQALVTPAASAASPRRVANGYDLARLHLLVAVLSKRLRLPLGSQDVVVNVAGGLRLKEPSADAAVALAIVSSFMDVPLPDGMAACGEIGLGGELRGVHQAGRRVAEARRLGFNMCLIPAGSAALGQNEAGARRVRSLTEAVQAAVGTEQARR
jgi:DNA repair protein RadA/Sms